MIHPCLPGFSNEVVHVLLWITDTHPSSPPSPLTHTQPHHTRCPSFTPHLHNSFSRFLHSNLFHFCFIHSYFATIYFFLHPHSPFFTLIYPFFLLSFTSILLIPPLLLYTSFTFIHPPFYSHSLLPPLWLI